MKEKKIKHFDEKSAARCVAYARRDGADDWELARLVIIALGLSNIPRLMAQSSLALCDVVVAGTAMTLLTSILGFMRGLKIFVEGKISNVAILPIEQFIRILFPKWQGEWGALLVFFATGEIIIEILILGITSIYDHIIYYKNIDILYNIDVKEHPFPITPPPINIDIFDVDYDQSKFDQFFEICDLLFEQFDSE